MQRPFDQLEPADQEWVLEELRKLLREPDREISMRRRKELAERLRADHPVVAAWIEEGSTSEASHASHHVLDQLPIDDAKLDRLRGKVVVIKYGGNAMIDETAKQSVIGDICALKSLKIVPVVVHGGGPMISELLGKVGKVTPFIEGHRKTDRVTMGYVEMALSGKVNSEIVKLIGFNGYKSVGISGKDGGLVTATKRIHRVREGELERRSDLGQVGDVSKVDTDLIDTLLARDYIPVIAPIGVGEDLEDYNINADMFAGHIAASLNAAAYIALSNVDGIFIDMDDPSTLIPEFTPYAARGEIGRIVQGGMIPKVESCLIALEGGVQSAHIINGTVEHSLLRTLLTSEPGGTTIHEKHD